MKKTFVAMMYLAVMMAANINLKAQEVTITLNPGWTWISVPLMDTLDFPTALGSFTPMQGDIIKSQWGSASYRGNGQWRGSVSQFYPGYGYMYKSNRTLPVNVIFQAQQSNPQNNVPMGAIVGLFSVSESQQVYFSQGNLQYQASTNTWRFAENQWDCLRLENANVSSSYDGWIDLFGWGTSGYDHGAVCYQPWSTSQSDGDYYVYGSSTYNLYDQTGQADWGYNAISNGGNTESQWRILTSDEWSYLLFSRNTLSGIRFAKAVVNNIEGLVVLPDNWDSTYNDLNETNNASANYSTNIITENDWMNVLEVNGALFLPAGSYRNGSSYIEQSNPFKAYYWTSSKVKYFEFNNSQLFVGNRTRNNGLSVRLVRTVQGNGSYTINTTCSPNEGGNVTGAGTYDIGQTCTLTAIANPGYTFTNWTKDGIVVSTVSIFDFTVTESATYVANFSLTDPSLMNYISDGLIMFIDGICNTRNGHSSTTNIWEDLIGNYDLTVTNYNSYTWEDNHFIGLGNGGYLNTGHSWQYFNSLNDDITIEIVTYIDCDKTSPAYRGLAGWHEWSDGTNFQNDQGSGRMQTLGQLPVSDADNTISTVTYTRTNGSFLNGIWKTNNNTIPGGINSDKIVVFGNSIPYSRGWNDSIYCIRMYNRSLTPEEIAYNHIVDRERFVVSNFPTGAINGLFSVSDSLQVYFSQGNLQYQATTNTWRFAENQWDCLRLENESISSSYDGWIDLFGWGTSGYNHGAVCYQPWSTSLDCNDYYAYGSSTYNLYDQTGQADWGYNAISNGGNTENQWRTLTSDEWSYLLFNRDTPSGIRFAKAIVNGIEGLVVLSDNWDSTYYDLNETNNASANYSTNIITENDWMSALEPHGVLLLPAGSYRLRTWVEWPNSYNGYYWASTCSNSNEWNPGYIEFNDMQLFVGGRWRTDGLSVRLVRSVGANPNPSISIPSVTTTEVTEITQTTAVCGGVVMDDGGTTVTERGICWSTSPTPTINDNHVSSGSGTGSYTVNMTGLVANTTYYVRAYATNGAGTAYGNDVSFITLQDEMSLPVVTTSSVYNITRNSAIGGGTVVSDGGYTVTERGICWSTSSNPTINSHHANNGTGLGNYTVNMSSLSANTTYYVKAYAINSAGVAYGDAVQIKTPPSATVNGCFSINGNGGKICFSKGNLQCRPSSETWKFADHQYDCIGTGNIYIQQSYTGYIDLFGWGTSGYPHGATCYEPWSTSMNDENYYAYGNSTYNLYDRTGYADWGNSGHSISGSNKWRTLKTEEWIYIINQRYTQSGLRYAKAQVNGVNGLILLPDDWSTSYYSLNYPDQYSVGYNTNVITSSQWSTLENHGAVFLPAAGIRGSSSVFQLNSTGAYWSSSCVGVMGFDGSSVGCNNNDRHTGRSVRLVFDTH